MIKYKSRECRRAMMRTRRGSRAARGAVRTESVSEIALQKALKPPACVACAGGLAGGLALARSMAVALCRCAGGARRRQSTAGAPRSRPTVT